MAIFGVYIINRAGGLIYQYDHNMPRVEVEKTYGFPLDISLKTYDGKVVVSFGQKDGVKVGHTVLSVNGEVADGRLLKNDNCVRDILDVINDSENYPIAIKFGRAKLSSNEKIMLAGMFHSLYAIACQLSPVERSSGVEHLETDTFKLHCLQTQTGIKFIVVTDPNRSSEELLLKKLYEIYSDFALKNPFYSLDMPVRCDLFDTNLQQTVEMAEKYGLNAV